MKALITGVSGQDGSYLAELLLEKGYEVWGLLHDLDRPNVNLIVGHPHFRPLKGDLRDESTYEAMAALKVNEVYHLAALQNIPESYRDPLLYHEVNVWSTEKILE